MPSPTNSPDWHRERVMVFIDGSNLYHVLSEVCSRHDLNFGKFAEKLADGRHLVRTYYYNIRQGPSESGVPSEQEKFLQSLYETPYLEIRMGISKKQGEMMVEKGVDVFMATDMVAFAFMDLYDTAIMVSGDGDFFPAIQAAKNQGKHIEVAAFEDNLSPEAANVADKVTLLNKSYFNGLWHDRRRRSTTSSRSGSETRTESSSARSSSSSNGRSATPSQTGSTQKAEASQPKTEEAPAASTPDKKDSESPDKSSSSSGRSSTRGGARRRRVSSTGTSGKSSASGQEAETQEAQSADQTGSSSSSNSSGASRSSRSSTSRSRRSRGGRSGHSAGESAESNDQESSSSSGTQVRRTPVRRRVGGARAQPEDGGDQGGTENNASGWLPRPPMLRRRFGVFGPSQRANENGRDSEGSNGTESSE